MLLVSLIAAAVAVPAATYPAVPIGGGDAKCPERPSAFHAVGDSALQPRRLDREPAASVYLSLYREVAGCATPVVLRRGDGR